MDIERQQIVDNIKTFKTVSPETYQLLAPLNYSHETDMTSPEGVWEIYTKKNFLFPYFQKVTKISVNKFVAILKGRKPSIVYGSYENLEEVQKNLAMATLRFISPPKRFFGIPLVLTQENAQDYGYIRGLLFGFILMAIDIGYSWIFKLRDGFFTGFIEYIKKVHDGNPNLAISIGIAGTGLYFSVLLIFIPILYGNICIALAKIKQRKLLRRLSAVLFEYDYGVQAEKSLQEEYTTIIEEHKKEAIYQQMQKLWETLEKEDFEFLYQRLQEGFVSPKSIYDFLAHLSKSSPLIDLKRFLETMLKFEKASLEIEIKLKAN